MEAVIDGLDDSLDNLITKEDIDSVLDKLVCVGNKSNRPSVLRVLFGTLQFTASSGRHSVLERPFSEANGRPFFS